MALITPAKQEIDFCLRTTKPFHNRKAAQDFFRLVDAYGPNSVLVRRRRPFSRGTGEPSLQCATHDERKGSWKNRILYRMEQLGKFCSV